MKRLTFLLSFTLVAICCNAQVGGTIVYTDYGGDTVVDFDHRRINFDVDFDGERDVFIENYLGAPQDFQQYIRFTVTRENYELAAITDLWEQGPGLGHDTIQMGDTISHCNSWTLGYSYGCYYCQEWMLTGNGFRGYLGTRKQVGDNYYYGWIEFKMHWYYRFNGLWVPCLILYSTAFCTIPDYPLMAGQTCLDWDVEENEATAFATVNPNPTNSLVTITGKDLKSAEVINALGQCVASATGESERLQIDLSSLPAGIYFINITDTEGRKCVRKVVKE